jgi:radical SAM-linked protein
VLSVQRLRITFARGAGANYFSHLDMMRAWERTLRRAGWKLAYSQGFNPHPKLSFAAALPVGVAASGELLEVKLDEPRLVELALTELASQMPPGLEVVAIREVPVDAPPIQRSLYAADYEAVCPDGTPSEQVEIEVGRVRDAGSLPRTRGREGKAVAYDLRPLIHDLGVQMADGRLVVHMRLRTDALGAGRADEVVKELGIDPATCALVRTRLLLSEIQPTAAEDA